MEKTPHMYAYISIGNSDDKLGQHEWSVFWRQVNNIIQNCPARIHFSGMAIPNAPWQNALWVLELDGVDVQQLRRDLNALRIAHQQDSIAWVYAYEDNAEFINNENDGDV